MTDPARNGGEKHKETGEKPPEIPETRINFRLPMSLRNDLDRIAKAQGRSGVADLLRQLGSEYVLWQKGPKPQPKRVVSARRNHPIWSVEHGALVQLVSTSKTLSEVIDKLGLEKDRDDHSTHSNNIRRLRNRLIEEGIDFTHCHGGEKPKRPESKFHKSIHGEPLSRARKARISETAVLFRLVLRGFQVFKPEDPGSKIDWLAALGDGTDVRYSKIQVKTVVLDAGYGSIPLTCSDSNKSKNKRRRYAPGEFDFIVGYDVYSDTAYVFSEKEVEHRKWSVAARREAIERWDKLIEHTRKNGGSKPAWTAPSEPTAERSSEPSRSVT